MKSVTLPNRREPEIKARISRLTARAEEVETDPLVLRLPRVRGHGRVDRVAVVAGGAVANGEGDGKGGVRRLKRSGIYFDIQMKKQNIF